MLEGQQAMAERWLLPAEQTDAQRTRPCFDTNGTELSCAELSSSVLLLFALRAWAGVLTGLLNKYLGDFIEGLDAEQLKLGSDTMRDSGADGQTTGAEARPWIQNHSRLA
jgi:hypothetical protein